MKYEEYLLEKLYECRDALGFENYKINIALERSFRMPKEPTTLKIFQVIIFITLKHNLFRLLHTVN